MGELFRLNQRLKQILSLVDEHVFLSVKELSLLCNASEITIRRDLEALVGQKLIQRTHGGAVSLRPLPPENIPESSTLEESSAEYRYLFDRLDALITFSTTDQFRQLLPEKTNKRFLPVISEATPCDFSLSCVAVDDFAAGKAMGIWAGQYMKAQRTEEVFILDLTYHLPNTITRSHGFMVGIKEILPVARQVLTLNTHSRKEMAYQLAKDALSIDSRINVIFAINDQNALGALQACSELNLDPQKVMVIPFGCEGTTMLEMLHTSPFIKGGLAMFPEIVGKMCVDAVILACNHQVLPSKLVTPFMVLTKENLNRFYDKTENEWKIRPEAMGQLELPLTIEASHLERIPKRVGFLGAFVEHEWYKNLFAAMINYGGQLGIAFERIDTERSLRDEIELRRKEIAILAVELVQPGDVIFIDNGPIASYFAQGINQIKNITVITNAMQVLEILKNVPEITLMGIGGVLRRKSQTFVGPTAETTIKSLHIDKLFLMVSGVSITNGLTHTDISEVTIKQLMINSSRQVILLADHSCFQQKSLVQLAPIKSVHTLITDDALPASIRVELSTLGIQVMLATM